MDHDLLRQPIAGIDPQTILTQEACNQFHQHMLECYPEECLGYIKDGQYHRLENTSTQKEVSGDIDKEVLIDLLDKGIDALCHSHPNGPDCPSGRDMQTQIDMDVPFVIGCTNGEACTAPFIWGSGLAKPPLLGRPFIHGVLDCVELIFDFYKEIMKVDLPPVARDWEWWATGNCPDEGMYEINFTKWGFEQVHDGLEFGDVLFLHAGSKVINHAAVYIGDHLILHHLSGRLENDPSRISTIEPVIRWRQNQRLGKVVRYKG